jgi:predicted aconitase
LNHKQSEYRLRALGAAAASTGSVGMFHVVGSTPEAQTLDAALGDNAPQGSIKVSVEDLQMMRSKLTSSTGTALATIALGTPHYSIDEFAILRSHILGKHKHPEIDFYVSAGRDVLLELELRGWADELRSFGVSLVGDTCTYFTPILSNTDKPAMTDSGKWAYYAPSNLGIDVIFASTADCVSSAIAGTVVLDESIWTNEQ